MQYDRWLIVLRAAWLSCVVVVLTPSTSAEANITDILPMLGPRSEVDVVGVLDRSHGVGQHNFYYLLRPFFESLLRQYAAIDRRFARSAIVTFARDATVVFDTISGGADAGVSKCELFSTSPALWDRVLFNANPDIRSGTNLTGALKHAVDILEQGKLHRPNVTQVKPRSLALYRSVVYKK